YQPAPKDAGFHVVQALLLLTRHLPLKEASVLLTRDPHILSHSIYLVLYHALLVLEFSYS
ncbi:hypothetical protein RK164_11075, partial [Streptococcus pneumoniae]|nr:hypothetical protein [Streptococcus pneumoniae]